MIISSFSKLEEIQVLIPRRFEVQLKSSCYMSIVSSPVIKFLVAEASSNLHSRSPHNREYFSFSAASSRTTKRRLPLELRAPTRLTNASSNHERNQRMV